MNNRRTAQVQKYSAATEGFRFIEFQDQAALYCCNACRQDTVFTGARIRHALKTNSQLTCTHCTEVTPPDFTLEKLTPEYRLLSCDDCGLTFHRRCKKAYFRCYCQLRTKRGEHAIFKGIWEHLGNPATRCTDCGKSRLQLSREECYPGEGNNHKGDILLTKLPCCTNTDTYRRFIEVDGASHDNTAQRDRDSAQEEAFLDNRKETDFIIRIKEDFVGYWDHYLLTSALTHPELDHLFSEPITRLSRNEPLLAEIDETLFPDEN